MSRKVVTMTIQVTFDGTYYGAGEVEAFTASLIDDAFEDRDNLTGWELMSSSVVESDGPGEYRSIPD